ncbi:MAG TPA: hypothetical protein VFY87_05975, partial [Geminicoccaceae bacterium]|nr:hypothetical protein [Geminicoccaceae bacterium]
NFAKRGIELTQSIIDQLKSILEPQLTGVSQRVKKAQRASGEDNTVDHSDAEKQIAGKAALLTKPSSSLKTRDVPEGEHTPKHHPKRSKDIETNTSESKPKIPSPICRFEYRHMEPGGVIFEPYLEGKVTVIAWNLDHPFYERFLAEYGTVRMSGTVYCHKALGRGLSTGISMQR